MEKPLEELLVAVRERVKFPEEWNPITNQADTIRVAQMCYPDITFAQNGPNMTVRWQQSEIPQVIKLIHFGTVVCKRIVDQFPPFDSPPVLPEVEYDERSEEIVEVANITSGALHLADEYGINLESVNGTGSGGRIIKVDIEKAIYAQLDKVDDE